MIELMEPLDAVMLDLPRVLRSKDGRNMMSGLWKILMHQFPQNYTDLTQTSKEIIKTGTKLNPMLVKEMNMECKVIIEGYEQMHNIDENLTIHTRHDEFIKAILLITLDGNSNSCTEAGKILANLLSRKITSNIAITRGIHPILKDLNDYMLNYKNVFNYIFTIVAPVLISKAVFFKCNSLMDVCIYLCPNSSSLSFNKIDKCSKSIMPVINESEEKRRMMSGLKSLMMPQDLQNTTILSLNYMSLTKVPELEPKVTHKIDMQYIKCIFQEYKLMHNLDDIIYSLVEDEKSPIRTRHDEFVKLILLITLDENPNSRTDAGKMLAELLSKSVISMFAVTRGIDAVLKDWIQHMLDYPKFFSYIAEIITPLLISNTASFEFCNLMEACIHVCPDNSAIFTEILQIIFNLENTITTKKHVKDIFWMYDKWRMSRYVTLDLFMPSEVIKTYFKNDRAGVFILCAALCDKFKKVDSKQSYDEMDNWINYNIEAKIRESCHFVQILTMAMIVVRFKPHHTFVSFFDKDQMKLLTTHIKSDHQCLTYFEIQNREIECLNGINLISSAYFSYPKRMMSKLFETLYKKHIIRTGSFILWKNENKTITIIGELSKFFQQITENKKKFSI